MNRREMTEELSEIIYSITGMENCPVSENLFLHGLDSLRALQLVNLIEKRFRRQLSLYQLYKNPSINQLCSFLQDPAPLPGLGEKRVFTDISPVQPLQFTFYMLEKLHERPLNNINLVFLVHGRVETGILQKTLQALIKRHGSLRTVFVMKNGVLQQQLKESMDLEFCFLTDDNFDQKELEKAEAPWNGRCFSMEEGPLFRFWQIRTGTGDYLIFNIHHIVFDGWSCAVLIRDFNLIYNELSSQREPQLAELPLSFFDYIAERELLKKSSYWSECRNYWQKQLAGYKNRVLLPLDFSPSVVGIFPAENYFFSIDSHQKKLLYAFAGKHGCTIFVVLLSIFKLWLYRISGCPDFCVGTAAANRCGNSDYEKITGSFVNTLPLRIDFSDLQTRTELLQTVNSTVKEALSRQDYPLEQILADLGRDGFKDNYPPFLQTMLVYHSYQQPPLCVGDYKTTYIPLYRKFTEHYFTFYAEDDEEGGIGINVEYASSCFRRSAIEAWGQLFIRILVEFISQENEELTFFLSEKLAESLLVKDSENIAQEKTAFSNSDIGELLQESCRKHDVRVAVYDSVSGLDLTYKDLWQRSGLLGGFLRSRGLKNGDLLAFSLQPGLNPLCLMLAILRCGASWLPVDLKSPPDRVTKILQQSGTDFYVSDKEPDWSAFRQKPVFISAEELFDFTKMGSVSMPEVENSEFSSEQVAYIIYTSGSTGEPKGVEISRSALCDFAVNAAKLYNFTEQERVLQFASWSFDACIEEIFPTLLCGGRLVIFPNSQLQSIPDFFHFIKEQQISVLDLPTAFWHTLVSSMITEGFLLPESVKTVIIGGEAASALLWQKWHSLISSQVKTFNTYGPTEATVVATVFNEKGAIYGSTVPIGKPLPHVCVYVFNAQGREAAIGEEGELWLGGSALANGYRYDEKRSSELFVYHPLADKRLYKTGDLVLMQADGNLVYRGRSDRQVKLRGFRIDCIEVENTILQCEGVYKVAVGVVEEQLVAFLVVGEIKTESIREHLQKTLPPYMHPVLQEVAAIPLNSSGKVDFKILAAGFLKAEPDSVLKQSRTISDEMTGVSLSESVVLEIWRDVLQKKDLSPEDNFFAVGGNSLLALQLIHRLSLAGFRVGIQDIFLHQSVRSMSAVLQMNTVQTAGAGLLPCIVKLCQERAEGGKNPLFLLHSIPGDILGYTELVLAMGSDRPCYGIQSPGMTDPDFIPKNIREMTSLYADQIISFYDGPLLVAGWCYGGILALELANEFRRRGRRVDFVGIMELSLPETGRKNLFRNLSKLWQLFVSGPSAWREFWQLHSFYRALFRRQGRNVYSLEYDGGFLKNRSRIAEANLSSLQDYKAEEFPSELKLFFGESYLKNPGCEWSLFTEAETFIFRANHRSILRNPVVKELAIKIKQLLAAVELNPIRR